MNANDIAALIRDIVIPAAIALVAWVLKKKWGIDADLAKREGRSALARDAMLYADQLAHSKWDPTESDGPALKEKALEFVRAEVPAEEEREKVARQIEAEIARSRTALEAQVAPIVQHLSFPPPAIVPGTERKP